MRSSFLAVGRVHAPFEPPLCSPFWPLTRSKPRSPRRGNLPIVFARSWKRGLAFGIAYAAAVAAIALTLNVALGGRFLADTVFANMNPMSTKKLRLS